ncbi:precorrin-4 C(11)-methyltransferase [Sanguibacteroides justesenii]|uniref:Cobalamin biosynthesis protein CbiG n=1 Tax=Sanguibacteroides justesenii TaxID=1547597 RepID=A0A0C3RDG0_9PORP|nr:precorrin-4 C(11)-methyltransferase [Sanguibacteroides justesenii]KIO44276.1 cobalamin biosynthesis protein CbiG [Sanguibacteroides justesenii]KIO45508.1 cobalamin biosynthesis protein CbiG [Sanguibacteroides justesenii]PXZ44792.1 precorrin-4 C(11)-methyltransferase [Sanguibacteroides justesenii]
MNSIAIIIASDQGAETARIIRREMPNSEIFSSIEREGCTPIDSIAAFTAVHFHDFDALLFIGALGICVRTIAPCIQSKYKDPAVINIDAVGKHVIPVLSGHVGGANELAKRIAGIIGGEAIITTQSDNTNLWALDTLDRQFGWKAEKTHPMNEIIAAFVNKRPTALLLDIRDKGTNYLEHTCPEHVELFYRFEDVPQERFHLLIAVTPRIYNFSIPTLIFRPPVLHMGIGCKRNAHPEGAWEWIKKDMTTKGLSPLSLKSISTIELKKEEPLIREISRQTELPLTVYATEDLQGIVVPNPSEKVFEVTSVYGVAESTALKSARNEQLLIEKQKMSLLEGSHFTYAIACDALAERKGFIEIVGAGPGDPELISVKGKRFLEQADLILYAGSLVPVELTYYAKPGATVRSSASMDLEEQFAIMKEFYDKGLFIVRLHTGDPCIYGAIQEQMAFFDEYGMHYHITPGISSFLAAAAALQSQFTIPEKVQTIILTRGEGRTPMPEKEKLHLLARSQSTMCIFLSASIAEQVQSELLEHYPPTTPVAACYHLTWKDERIYRGELKDLARIIKENHLTLTTMIVVGEAIDNRQGLSRLYSHQFKHLFRK